MRLTTIILIGTVVYISNASISTATTAAIDSLRFIVDQDVFPVKRMLRSYDGHDEDRVGGLEKFKAGVSKLTEAAKLKSYLAQNKDAVEVLAKLKLGNDALGALRNSKMNALTKYIDMFNKKNPDKAMSLISTLTARYGDDGLAKALVIAEKEATTPATVKEIQTLRNDQLTTWLNTDKSVDDVFHLLKLHIDGNVALSKVEVLEEYIKKINTAKSEHITLLDTLRTGFSGDDKLVSVIAMAKMGEANMETKGLELETALITKWTNENVIPERIFRRLKLNKNGNVENVLSSDKLETFTKYVDEFNKKNPNRETSLFQSLTTNYGDTAVAKGLVLAKGYSSTESLVTQLQIQLFEKWMGNGKSIGDVAKLLKVEATRETLVKALATGFGGDDKLSLMLLTAKTKPNLEEKATKLQNEQFKQWLKGDIDPYDVLTKVFKIPRQQWHLATDRQKAIAKEFKSFERNSRTKLQPRRA
ncbi:Avirulence (Avh) protein [Phytophthora megakarya]|uniref:Avirulence (Avh) protein n=1 Tax=Phytophthora megakarya TaxID=4795 RepID=A0A225WTC2_9STRA|nr:Avirulence (Avh) protein [Phytophthora megakarya]